MSVQGGLARATCWPLNGLRWWAEFTKDQTRQKLNKEAGQFLPLSLVRKDFGPKDRSYK